MNSAIRTPCLPGTRTRILDGIIQWAVQPETDDVEKNILWLHGMAGSGKSAIATTIAQYFDRLGRQGAYLFFERSTSDPAVFVRTLAYKLARFDANLRRVICETIEADGDIAEKSLRTQFEKLLQQPLEKTADGLAGPIVIILDALDECGDANSRGLVLKLLVEDFPKLPSIFRFLITSRREHDIASQFTRNPESIKQLDLAIVMNQADSDIQAYIWSSLKEIRVSHGLPDEWPKSGQVKQLAQYSEGLFIWVSTMCILVRDALSPKDQLDTLLQSGHIQGLDSLYTASLAASCSWVDAKEWGHFKSVMTVVFFSRERLRGQTIDRLLGIPDCCQRILARLHCVLDYSPGGLIRPLHASFRDYLIEQSRSGGKPWSLSSFDPESHLAMCCFRVMSHQLCFNIYKIESSYQDRFDYLDDEKASTLISSELRYASVYWSAHLSAVRTRNDPLISMLDQFSRKQLLFWLEVLSLLRRAGSARNVCSTTWTFIKVHFFPTY